MAGQWILSEALDFIFDYNIGEERSRGIDNEAWLEEESSD